MIEKGKPAPTFTLKDQNAKERSLEEFKNKNIVLFFYPKDDTPGCTKESKEFSEKLNEFKEKNTIVIGISKDSTESHFAFCTKHNLNVILLSDPEGKMIEEYGVWQEKTNYGITKMGIVRTTLLLNSEHHIIDIWKNVKVDGHVDKVLEKVKKLNG